MMKKDGTARVCQDYGKLNALLESWQTLAVPSCFITTTQLAAHAECDPRIAPASVSFVTSPWIMVVSSASISSA